MRRRIDSHRAKREVRRGWALLLQAVLAAATWNLVPVAFAQAGSVSTRAYSHHKKAKPEPPLITETAPDPPPPPLPPPVLTPEQMPPRPPEVVWDGKLLSINAENSTLSDILVAVRTRTGAAIDVPTGTARERMAARLGPGPVREVLTSLLSGTDYDYIIQASETDEDAIQSVILTPRGKGDDMVASSMTGSVPGIRRSPGYTSSGRHTFEVMPAETNQSPAAEDVASTGDQTGQPTATADAEPAPASAPNADLPQADRNSSAATAVASSDGLTVGRGLLPGIDPNAGPPTFDKMVQGMQQLFEQRRQIQMQQNQAQQRQLAPPPPSN